MNITVVIRKEVANETEAQELFDHISTYVHQTPDVDCTGSISQELTESS